MSDTDETVKTSPALTQEEINELVVEHMGWAQSIARSVAKAWNMDWQLDGLDGGAYEGLLFCASRYDPARGVPFKSYARRRIHEASTEEARKSKTWQRGVGTNSEAEQSARDISARLFDIFPELHAGLLPASVEGDPNEMRSSLRQLLSSASMLVAAPSRGSDNPETAAEYREVLRTLAKLSAVHQQIIWEVYWKGISMRQVAESWKLDELTVIREHKQILSHVNSMLSGERAGQKPMKIRPGLRKISQTFEESVAPFSKLDLGFIIFELIFSMASIISTLYLLF